MVEVQFKLADAEKLKDHFLSVRIGDVQRIARVNAKRGFKFPASAVGTRKYGKVEVFRKVGSSALSIDPAMASGTNDVECLLDGGMLLSMTADVVGTDAKGLQKEHEAEMASSPKGLAGSPSHRAVAEYLSKHHLEVRLSDAMQKVLRERPDDPARVLAEMLLSNADTVAKLPKPCGSPAPPELPAHPEAAEVPLKASKPPVGGAQPTAAQAEPQKERAAPVEKGADLRKFGEYYDSNFQCHAKGLASLYGKFQVAPRISFPAKEVGNPPVDTAHRPDSQAEPPKFLPSMGSFHGPAGVNGGIVLLQAAPVPTHGSEVISAQPAERLQPSMGSFHGPVGRYGGIVSFNPGPDASQQC